MMMGHGVCPEYNLLLVLALAIVRCLATCDVPACRPGQAMPDHARIALRKAATHAGNCSLAIRMAGPLLQAAKVKPSPE